MDRIINSCKETKQCNSYNKINLYLRWTKFRSKLTIMVENFKWLIKRISQMIIKWQMSNSNKIRLPIRYLKISMCHKWNKWMPTRTCKMVRKIKIWTQKKTLSHKNQVNDKFITFKQMFSRWPKSTKCCQKDLNLMSWNRCKNKLRYIKRKRRDLPIIW